ncbi:MAG: hypothetical protein N3C61_01455 [Candidatus Micrarchaeota archaeon]|nr:hypothetical protein [Candidatus Micrarchaeota archaeon]
MRLEDQIKKNLELAREYLNPIKSGQIGPGIELDPNIPTINLMIDSKIQEPNLRRWREIYRKMNEKILDRSSLDGFDLVRTDRGYIPFEFYCFYSLYSKHLNTMNIHLPYNYVHPKFGYVGGFLNNLVMIPMFLDEILLYNNDSYYETYLSRARDKPRIIDGIQNPRVSTVGKILLKIGDEVKSSIDLLGIPVNRLESDSYGNKYYNILGSFVMYREGRILIIFDDRLKHLEPNSYVLHHNTLGIIIRKYLNTLHIELKSYNPEVL